MGFDKNSVLMREFVQFAANASAGTFPDLARKRAVDAITDCLGCIIAGTPEPSAKNVRNITHFVPGPSQLPSLVGSGGYTTPGDAALCNGTAAHALDFDDTNHPAYAHPSAVLVPALLAVAPLSSATGSDLVTAYIVGLEMIGKLGRALNTAHYRKGWHSTSSFGAPAAALAVGRLLRLSETQLMVAIGIAASATGGLRANFGTMIKPLHAGLAARSGVTAALLAQSGFDASPQAFDHRFGYLAVFQGDETANINVLRTPGEPLEILTDFGLALKPYPSCGATHPGIEAACILSRRVKDLGSIQKVVVGVAEMALNPLIYSSPVTPLQAKFSMEFCAAAGLALGRVNLETFSDEKLRDSRIKTLMSKTSMAVDDRVRHDPEFATHIRVEYADGSSDEEFVPLAKGKPHRWMSRDEIRQKFDECAGHAGLSGMVERGFDLVQQIDSDRPAGDFQSVFER